MGAIMVTATLIGKSLIALAGILFSLYFLGELLGWFVESGFEEDSK
jgi:hypothetical protein